MFSGESQPPSTPSAAIHQPPAAPVPPVPPGSPKSVSHGPTHHAVHDSGIKESLTSIQSAITGVHSVLTATAGEVTSFREDFQNLEIKTQTTVDDIQAVKEELGIVTSNIEGVKEDVFSLSHKIDTASPPSDHTHLLLTMERQIRDLALHLTLLDSSLEHNTQLLRDVQAAQGAQLSITALRAEFGRHRDTLKSVHPTTSDIQHETLAAVSRIESNLKTYGDEVNERIDSFDQWNAVMSAISGMPAGLAREYAEDVQAVIEDEDALGPRLSRPEQGTASDDEDSVSVSAESESGGSDTPDSTEDSERVTGDALLASVTSIESCLEKRDHRKESSSPVSAQNVHSPSPSIQSIESSPPKSDDEIEDCAPVPLTPIEEVASGSEGSVPPVSEVSTGSVQVKVEPDDTTSGPDVAKTTDISPAIASPGEEPTLKTDATSTVQSATDEDDNGTTTHSEPISVLGITPKIEPDLETKPAVSKHHPSTMDIKPKIPDTSRPATPRNFHIDRPRTHDSRPRTPGGFQNERPRTPAQAYSNREREITTHPQVEAKQPDAVPQGEQKMLEGWVWRCPGCGLLNHGDHQKCSRCGTQQSVVYWLSTPTPAA